MNTRNGYCQMKKTVPRPNADCAKGTATLKDYLKKPEETEASTLKSQPSKPQEGMHQSETVSMSKFTLTQEQHKAEILWALKSVMSHVTYH